MHKDDSVETGSARALGLAIGLSPVLGAWSCARWSQIGEVGALNLVGMGLMGGLMGAAFWPFFARHRQDLVAPMGWHAGLFGALVGLATGSALAFPMGGAGGTLAGAVGASVTGWMYRRGASLASRTRWCVAAASGLGAGWVVTAWWVA